MLGAMSCEWLRGKWSWPPLESDPSVFQALARELLGAGNGPGVGAAAGSPLQDLLVSGSCSVSPPCVDEVLSFEADGSEALLSARALLVCFHSHSIVSGGLPPAAAAAAAVGARAAEEGAFFMRQVFGLDAACGIIGLVHALLNADGLLCQGSVMPPQLSEGPLARWLDALPPDATPEQRGRALVADRGIRSVYRVQAARGQSRMPSSPIWAVLSDFSYTWALLSLLGAAIWIASVVVLGSRKGGWAAAAYVGASLVWLLIWYLLCECRCCGSRRVRLECHFVCLAARSGRILLLDGLQAAAQDVGACEEGSTGFAANALAFVRDALLPNLSQPDTCSILALRPASYS